MSASIFKQIIDKKIKAEILHEDDQCLVIKDINPQAPFHALIIPKREIKHLGEIEESDSHLMGHLLNVCKTIAIQAGISQGFRVVINNGAQAGQSVDHLHFHVLGGRLMKWPPG
jgi:histidine triad (HIT) family protein